MLKSKLTTCKEPDSLIGHLNYAAKIAPLAYHFLGYMQCSLKKTRKRGRINLSAEALADLELWHYLLSNGNSGTSMNIIAECYLDHIFSTNSCENSIRGFSLFSDQAWCFELSNHLKRRVSNNVLESSYAARGVR